MKRIIPMILALLLLTACAAMPGGAAPAPTEAAERHDLPPAETTLPEAETPAEPVVETPAEPVVETPAEPDEETAAPMEDLPPEPWPEFLAEPAAGGYEFRSETLGCSFTVPAEISQKVAVAGGVRYHDPEGTCLTFYYVPENGRYPLTMFYLVAATPRAAFFRPGSWYYSTQTGHSIVAIREDSVLFTMGPLGG